MQIQKKYVLLKTIKPKQSLKRPFRISVLVLALMCLAAVISRAKVEKGLLFHSYEVVPDLRTSLEVPASGDRISFKDSLVINFDIRFELERGRFGYVCRLFVDENDPVDLLLVTPWGENTFLGATGDHRNIQKVYGADSLLGVWQTVRIVLKAENDRLRAFVNGSEVYQSGSSLLRHGGSVSFGRGNAGRSATDVAPMILRNLSIRADRRRPWQWPLESEAEFKRGGMLSAQLNNPVWVQDYNREWRKVWEEEMPSVTFLCPDTLRRRVWFVSNGKVVRYDARSREGRSLPSARKMGLGLAVNDLVILPDGSLAYADGDNVPQLIRYDEAAGDWEGDNPRERSSQYLHHNSLYLPADSSYVYLFGYGHYRYQKSAHVWNLAGSEDTVLELPGVFPRYLSGAGCREGLVYVLGGKGNDVGIQELGTRLYNDFLSLNLRDGTVSRLWKSEVMADEVPAPDILFSRDGTSFQVLTYDPEVYESGLQLRRFSMADGSSEPLGTRIPYPFLDIESEARLLYDSEDEKYIAALSFRDKDGVFRAAVYELDSPVLGPEPVLPEKHLSALWGGLLLAAACMAVLYLLLRKRKKGRGEAAAEPLSTVWEQTGKENAGPSVRLLGGFHVRDLNGQDISSRFSQQTERFFVILILYTAKDGGISNAKLKSILWPDKSDESYNNNRGVTMRKIRTVLEQVGAIDFVSENGLWKVRDEGGLCDYLRVCAALQQPLGLEDLLAIAAEGPLLPELSSDFLDAFKARYANRILERLEEKRKECGSALSPDLSIRISDAALLFDSLDEEAIRLKCRALIEQKKLGSAQSVFSRFTEEFERVMGEPFSKNFKEFIKN